MAESNFTPLPTPDLFSARLNVALAYRMGDLPEREKIQFVAQATGRAIRTACAWVRGGNLPHRNSDIHTLAAALRADYVWLHFGIGYNPMQADLYEKLLAMPPEYVPKLTRYLLRLKNGDSKALRWSAMVERGGLSGWQVLDMA